MELKKFAAPIVYFIWLAAVFDPIGQLGTRFIALGLGLCLVFFSKPVSRIFSKNSNFQFSFLFYVIFLMPFYGLTLSLVRGGLAWTFVDTSYMAAGLLLVLSLIYKDKYTLDLGIRALVFSQRLQVLAIFCVLLTGIFSYSDQWLSFLTKYDLAFLGFRTYAGITSPYIYFLASPMLIFLIGYDANRFLETGGVIKLAFLILSILALALTGTR